MSGNKQQNTQNTQKNDGDKVVDINKTTDRGATRAELEALQADLGRQQSERLQALSAGDPLLREIAGAIKGIEYALVGPGE